MLKAWAAVVLCVILAVPVVGFSLLRWNEYGFGLGTSAEEDWERLLRAKLGRYLIIDYVNRRAGPGETLLVFQTSDYAYYGQRKIIAHTDPRLLELFAMNEPEAAYRWLLSMGIRYVCAPDHFPPTYYNSVIHKVTGNPRYCELVVEHESHQLFRVLPEPRSFDVVPVILENSDFSKIDPVGNLPVGWSITCDGEGDSSLATVEEDRDRRHAVRIQNAGRGRVSFHSGRGPVDISPRRSFYRGNTILHGFYRFQAGVRGAGSFQVYVVFFTSQGEPRRLKIWHGYLKDEYTTVANQFKALELSGQFRVEFVLGPRTCLWVRQVQMDHIGNEADRNDPQLSDSAAEKWKSCFATPSSFLQNDSGCPAGWGICPENRCWGLTLSDEAAKSTLYCKQQSGESTWFFQATSDAQSMIRLSERGLTMESLAKRYAFLPRDWVTWWAGGILTPEIDGRDNGVDYRLTMQIRGAGGIDVFVWGRGAEGPVRSVRVGRYFLPYDFQEIQERFRLPTGFGDVHVAFRLWGEEGRAATLYIKKTQIDVRVAR